MPIQIPTLPQVLYMFEKIRIIYFYSQQWLFTFIYLSRQRFLGVKLFNGFYFLEQYLEMFWIGRSSTPIRMISTDQTRTESGSSHNTKDMKLPVAVSCSKLSRPISWVQIQSIFVDYFPDRGSVPVSGTGTVTMVRSFFYVLRGLISTEHIKKNNKYLP